MKFIQHIVALLLALCLIGNPITVSAMGPVFEGRPACRQAGTGGHFLQPFPFAAEALATRPLEPGNLSPGHERVEEISKVHQAAFGRAPIVPPKKKSRGLSVHILFISDDDPLNTLKCDSAFHMAETTRIALADALNQWPPTSLSAGLTALAKVLHTSRAQWTSADTSQMIQTRLAWSESGEPYALLKIRYGPGEAAYVNDLFLPGPQPIVGEEILRATLQEHGGASTRPAIVFNLQSAPLRGLLQRLVPDADFSGPSLTLDSAGGGRLVKLLNSHSAVRYSGIASEIDPRRTGMSSRAILLALKQLSEANPDAEFTQKDIQREPCSPPLSDQEVHLQLDRLRARYPTLIDARKFGRRWRYRYLIKRRKPAKDSPGSGIRLGDESYEAVVERMEARRQELGQDWLSIFTKTEYKRFALWRREGTSTITDLYDQALEQWAAALKVEAVYLRTGFTQEELTPQIMARFPYMTLGQRVEILRRLRGISQKNLAEGLGWKVKELKDLIRDKKAFFRQTADWKTLAGLLKIDPFLLMTGYPRDQAIAGMRTPGDRIRLLRWVEGIERPDMPSGNSPSVNEWENNITPVLAKYRQPLAEVLHASLEELDLDQPVERNQPGERAKGGLPRIVPTEPFKTASVLQPGLPPERLEPLQALVRTWIPPAQMIAPASPAALIRYRSDGKTLTPAAHHFDASKERGDIEGMAYARDVLAPKHEDHYVLSVLPEVWSLLGRPSNPENLLNEMADSKFVEFLLAHERGDSVVLVDDEWTPLTPELRAALRAKFDRMFAAMVETLREGRKEFPLSQLIRKEISIRATQAVADAHVGTPRSGTRGAA